MIHYFIWLDDDATDGDWYWSDWNKGWVDNPILATIFTTQKEARDTLASRVLETVKGNGEAIVTPIAVVRLTA